MAGIGGAIPSTVRADLMFRTGGSFGIMIGEGGASTVGS
jgi:hypothetical protein